MKGKRAVGILAGTALAVLSTSVSFTPTAVAQRRVVEDTSTVKVAKRAPRTITRGPRTVATARQATNGVLVVLTDPPAASVKINGQVAGTSDAQGEFTKELRAGSYKVEVVAGNEYVPLAQTVKLVARGTEIVRAPLVSVSASKFGLVKIGPALEGAKIYVDEQPWTKVTLDRDENVLLVDGIAPGKHKLRVDHPDYVIVEKVFANVSAGDEYYWVHPGVYCSGC